MNVPANRIRRAFWLMLMKPPAPASRGPKRLTLTLPSRVDLRHAQAREVEAAAVVEIELLVLVQHAPRVLIAAPKSRPPCGRPPMTPGSAVSVR